MDTYIQIQVEEKFNAKEKKLHVTSKLKKEIIFNTVTYIDTNTEEKNNLVEKWSDFTEHATNTTNDHWA